MIPLQKYLLPLRVIFGLGILLFAVLFSKSKLTAPKLLSLSDHTIVDWQLEGQPLRVEVVNTPASITQGLGGREQLEIDGMLFVFDQPTQSIFWMKGMLFPIDIVWIADEKIVGIEKNVLPPASGALDQDLLTYPAPQMVDMVLETNPGRLSKKSPPLLQPHF